MSDLNKLADIMRSDWNRRVNHDYRFWMSDGYKTDAAMWESGERDFAIISKDIPNLHQKRALEIGCGVGRMLRSAVSKCGHVIGIDVSEEAIKKAKQLLGEQKNLEIHVGSGVDLKPTEDKSIDLVWSFASLTSMPTLVIGEYLREIQRVLKPDGIARIQVYLGEEMLVSENDTLHLRCYKRENFINAIQASGLKVEDISELLLPFQVSFKEIGVEAFIATIKSTSNEAKSPEEIAKVLLPNGEPSETAEISPSEIEYWMSVNYAEQLVAEGEIEQAKRALEFAVSHSKTTAIDVKDLLDRIIEKVQGKTEAATAAVKESPQVIHAEFNSEIYEQNIKALEDKFPNAATLVKNSANQANGVEIRASEQGPVLFVRGHFLDHPQKPVSGAEVWVKRALTEERFKSAGKIVVFGFGCGYHVEELCAQSKCGVGCIEPDVQSFKAALGSRDLRKCLTNLQSLSIGEYDSLDLITKESELLLRPQTQAVFGEYGAKIKGLFYGKRGMISLHPNIAVVGPMQGGTLPITQYTYNSLVRLEQRARGLDMSGFNSGFELMDQFVKLPQRKSMLQNTYAEMLSQVLLETFNEKPIDILICMAQAPITPRALLELRKKGVITVLWFVEDYLRFHYWQEYSQFYDFVFTIQKGECLSAIKQAGAGEVHYLPTACDQGIHIPMTLSAEDKERWGSPISFVGAGYYNRTQMFASLANLPFKIWGTEWPGCKPFDRLVQEQGRRLKPEEYVKIFNSTDINLNLHSSMERDGVDPYGDFVNPRTFELASVGAFQLVDERSLLPEMFEPGQEIITFSSAEQLKDQIEYYLAHPEERRQIAAKAQARALKDHTYDIRIEQMLSTIFASKYEQLRSRAEHSPWSKMLARAKPYEELSERCQKAFKRGEEPSLDALVSDIVTGQGKLSETEQKLLFLFHIRKQIIRMTREEAGERP